MGHTSMLLCAVCTPAFCLLWYVLGITCHVSHQQTLLPVSLPTRGTKQVVAVSMEVATLFRSRSSYTAGSGGSTAGHGAGLLDDSCSTHQQYLPCQDNDLARLPGSFLIPSCIHGEGSRRTSSPSFQFACDWYCSLRRRSACQSNTLGRS